MPETTSIRQTWGTTLVWLCVGLIANGPAFAHLMPANRGTVSAKGNNIYVVQAVPVSAIIGFDKNNDGLIDITELSSSYEGIKAQVKQRMTVEDSNAKIVEADTFLVSAAGSDHPDAPIDYFVAMSAYAFSAPPTELTMWTDLFGTKSGEDQIRLRASLGTQTEIVTLTPDRPTYHFFKSGPETFLSYVVMGIEHILGGIDHLLFLLAMIAVPFAVSRLLLIVTGFSLSHAVTFAAASLGLVKVPANIIEPLIALSIVLLAVDNLRHKVNHALWARFGIVFACGLVHGLGFASAVASFGLDTGHLIASLIGFNLGVELGQLAFVTASVLVGWLLVSGGKKINVSISAPNLRKSVSALAFGLGLVFLVQRVSPFLAS